MLLPNHVLAQMPAAPDSQMVYTGWRWKEVKTAASPDDDVAHGKGEWHAYGMHNPTL